MILLLLIFPFIELYAWYLFIDRYSFFDALLLIFSGGGLGLILMRTQGQSSLLAVQASLSRGQVPTSIIFHRGLVMLGGLLIFLPGLVSKVIGTFLIMPGTRHLTVLYMKWFFLRKIASGNFRVYSHQQGFGFSSQSKSPQQEDRDVIDVQPQILERSDKS